MSNAQSIYTLPSKKEMEGFDGKFSIGLIGWEHSKLWFIKHQRHQPKRWSILKHCPGWGEDPNCFMIRPKLLYDQTQPSAHPCVPRPKLQGLDGSSSGLQSGL